MDADSNSGQICLSINGTSQDAVLAVAAEHGPVADVVEIRLDLLAQPQVAPFLENITVPLIFTNRPEWEGGQWAGSEDERVAFLQQAARLGARYVDIELKAPQESFKEVISTVATGGCQAIVSWHNFTDTPSDAQLRDILAEMADSGADIGKIVTTAHDYSDTLRVLALQLVAQEMAFPLACFCMGKAGQISRAATLQLGGVLTYGAADSASCTAPGQLTVADLRQMQEILR